MRYERRTLLGLALLVSLASCTATPKDNSNTQETGAPSSQYGNPDAPTPEFAKERSEPVVMDPCLVGTWKTESIVSLNDGWVKRGGGGATVTFQADGLQIVDYTGMDPLSNGGEKPGRIIWEGKSAAIISAAQGKARVIEGREAHLTTESISFYGSSGGKQEFKVWKDAMGRYGGEFLGPAGLGPVQPENLYTCSGDYLTYESNTSTSTGGPMNDGSSNAAYTVKLRRAVNPNLKSQ